MPYKDIERRKRFHREYKRRRRQEQANSARQFKAYICPHIPFIRIGYGLHFENALLVTDQIEEQDMIEAHAEFGRHIFRISLDLSGIPVADE